LSSTFEQKREKFKERYDRLNLLFQWIKKGEITLNQFEELLILREKIHQQAIFDDE